MNITYTRTYTDVKVFLDPETQLPDVVREYYCILTGTDADSGLSFSTGFSVHLEPPTSPTGFVLFSNLTKEILDTWTDNLSSVNSYEQIITSQIESQLAPPVIIKELPFAQ